MDRAAREPQNSLGDMLALSLSRRREFLADAGAVELTGDVAALAEALARIWRLQGDDWERLATRGAGWVRRLRGHPTVEERIATSRAMAAPARQVPPGQDRIAVVPVELWGLGGHHPAQRLAPMAAVAPRPDARMAVAGARPRRWRGS